MKIAASTMGKNLEVFISVLELIQEGISVEKVGLYVSDSQFFKAFSKKQRFLKDDRFELLKEWDITSAGKSAEADWKRISSYEKKIGDPSLWNVLLSDRRLFFGQYCKQKQDYVPRFSYEQMAAILDQALFKIDDFIKKINPDIILSFGTATFGDYLFYLFARAYRIPFLQLKSTKIGNYVALNDTAVGLSQHIKKICRERQEPPEHIAEQAQEFLSSVKHRGLKYEGSILSNRSLHFKRLFRAPLYLASGLYGSLTILMDQELRNDNHLSWGFVPALYNHVLQPLKTILDGHRMRRNRKFLSRDELPLIGDYLFYPLHFEPEVSLQVFGRPYQNQIELIRNLSLSVPVGMKVIVKEHPRSFGFRPYTYYRKLLEMPNVYLVDPYIKAHEIVYHAKIVAVVSGTIGFEASICGKPVLTFGNVPYNILPATMVRHVTDLNRLGYELLDIMDHYSYDHQALRKYVGATLMGAVPVDLYTVLLNKESRYSKKVDGIPRDEQRLRDYERLSLYCIERIRKVMNRDTS